MRVQESPLPRSDTHPIVVTQRSRGVLGTILQVVTLLLLLAILGAVMLMLFAVASLMNVSGGVGSQLGSVTSQASRALTGAQQAIQNATDPNHPPSGLTYDTQFTSIQTWHLGDGLPGGNQYVLTVRSIQRRSDAGSPETALYAVIHAELRQPNETRILGQVIHSDSDPHDYAVYAGEIFRIGRSFYRMNWISQEDNEVAAGVLRNPDAVTQPLKFEYE